MVFHFRSWLLFFTIPTLRIAFHPGFFVFKTTCINYFRINDCVIKYSGKKKSNEIFARRKCCWKNIAAEYISINEWRTHCRVLRCFLSINLVFTQFFPKFIFNESGPFTILCEFVYYFPGWNITWTTRWSTSDGLKIVHKSFNLFFCLCIFFYSFFSQYFDHKTQFIQNVNSASISHQVKQNNAK